MIIDVEQIHIPKSGIYKEVIYDIQSSWNSQIWTWLKFRNDDYEEWCGEFRGEFRNFAYSDKNENIVILTSDYMYQISRINGKLIDYIDRPEYIDVTASPNGEFIISDYYGVYVINNNIRDTSEITLPIHLDMIKFCGWNKNSLRIEAVELCNWDNVVTIDLNICTREITVINQSKQV
ncbi:hypothetical protein EHE19_012670 [Ruminiclostridium herbifermentans]|uniref:Uncharacterized protein n=1 Tax=Ruminiclostridium herbifermentans TaxID=2488810 RepID=A0A4U7JDU4_9FIRM|nr:hypothetical protein [Ruminiclostridium herbifermentans]QNU65761.1 hypothetical protein EHE19_012670 [Ruminiclostridium herbifermentans]